MSIDYVRIPASILSIKELNPNQKIILSLAASLRNGLTLTNEKIAEIVCLSESRVSALVNDMQRLEYVRIVNPQSKYRTIHLAENSKVTALSLSRKQSSKKACTSPKTKGTSLKPKSTSLKTPDITKETEKTYTTEIISSDDFKEYWNKYDNLPKIHTFTRERKRQLQTRCKEREFTGNWKSIIDKLSGSPFHTGQSKSGWKATVDWILKNESNYVKILELPDPDYGTRDVSEDEADALLAEVMGE